LHYRFVN
jgi:predicted ATP-dependent protease